MVSSRRVVGAFVVVVVGLVGSGCHTPLIRTEAGSFESTESERYVDSRPGVAKQVLLYLPNRLIDALDMVHLGLGPELSLGFDVRITRWGQLALQAGAGAAVGWDDREHVPAWANASATAALGPWRAGAGGGNAPSVGDWEIGVASSSMKFAIDAAEIVDFVLGFFFIDILEDDYGWE